MISYVIPTRNRPERLVETLGRIGELPDHDAIGGAEVIVVDNASDRPAEPPDRLANGIAVTLVERAENEGAASRNVGVARASERSEWIVMLDDDSFPIDLGFIPRLLRTPPETAAVSADIFLPITGRREMGGLPSVFIGCGVAIRRTVFLELGGYDPAFNYYVEEYDLAARMLMRGLRVEFDRWFRVEHHKDPAGRDFNTIVARLVRNNGWVMRRYAPESRLPEIWRDLLDRYAHIAEREGARPGYERGLVELEATAHAQPRTPMTESQFDEFMGLTQAREAMSRAAAEGVRSGAVVDEGKHAWAVRRAMRDAGIKECPLDEHPDALIVGTMSPGPMLDACERRRALSSAGPRIVAPWTVIGDQLRAKPECVLTGGSRREADQPPRGARRIPA